MKVIYLAHPLGRDEATREGNRQDAIKWFKAFAEAGYALVADWIILSGVETEEFREQGLKIDLALVERCDELWMVGSRVSPGMEMEATHALGLGLVVRDLTGLTLEDLPYAIEQIEHWPPAYQPTTWPPPA